MTCRKLYEVALFVGPGKDKELIHYLNKRFEDPCLGPGLHKRYISFRPMPGFMNDAGKYRQGLIYYVDEYIYEILQFIKSEYIDKNKPIPGY